MQRSGQGSVLGPILFVIFINDIVDASPNGNTVKLFADDLKSYVSGNVAECKDKFVSSVSDLLHWAKIWQLPVAFKKYSWGRILYWKEHSCAIWGRCFNESLWGQRSGVKFDFKLTFSSDIDEVSKSEQRLFLLQKCIIST